VSEDILKGSKAVKKEDKKHQRKVSENKLVQSLPKQSTKSSQPKLPSPSRQSSTASDQDSFKSSKSMTPRDAPMLSRRITAQAELSADVRRKSSDPGKNRERAESSPATLLAIRLMEIFEFEKPEKVVGEYPCWLLQSVLLQGYMYITKNHICFYAYLPKKSNLVAKTGYLSKRGRQNPKYNRYWFTLKGDVLSYYSNPSDVYFPHGTSTFAMEYLHHWLVTKRNRKTLRISRSLQITELTISERIAQPVPGNGSKTCRSHISISQ